MIRVADISDRMPVLDLCQKFMKESEYPFSIDYMKMRDSFNEIVGNNDYKIFLYDGPSKPVGMLIAGVATTPFSSDRVGTELAWYVDKEYRGKAGAIKLIKEYEEWAKERQCKFITLSCIPKLNDLDVVYNRLGYELTEKSYVKRL